MTIAVHTLLVCVAILALSALIGVTAGEYLLWREKRRKRRRLLLSQQQLQRMLR